MQKRGSRAVETQKLKKSGRRKLPEMRESSPNLTYHYAKTFFYWSLIILADVFTGFRWEMFYPFVRLVWSFFESYDRRASIFSVGYQSSAVLFVVVTVTSDLICYLFIPIRSLIFVSTLYVWLSVIWHMHGGFVRTMAGVIDRSLTFPVTLAWVFFILFELLIRSRCDNYVSNIVRAHMYSTAWTEVESCQHMLGLHPFMQRGVNAFLGAHCIGYPLILVSVNVSYYYKEWLTRRKQDSVGEKNESLYRLLANAVPIDFELSRLYRRTDYMEDECCDDDYVLDVPAMLPIAAPPLTTPSTVSTANTTPVPSPPEFVAGSSGARDQGSGLIRRGNGARMSISGKSSAAWKSRQNGRTAKEKVVYDDDDWCDDMSDVEHSVTRNGNSSMSNGRQRLDDAGGRGGVNMMTKNGVAATDGVGPAPLIVRILVWAATRLFGWLLCAADAARTLIFMPPSRSNSRRGDRTTQHDGASSHESVPSKQRSRVNGRSVATATAATPTGRPKTTSSPAASQNGSANASSASSVAESMTSSMSNGRSRGRHSSGHSNYNHYDALATLGVPERDVSRESSQTHASEDSNGSTVGGRLCGVECAKLASDCSRLRGELRAVRQSDEAARLHATNCANGEKNALAECSQLKGRLEQMMNKISSLERQRDAERAATLAAERKTAEAVTRAADLEKELLHERKERKSERANGVKRSETVSEALLREKEAAWEREAERLRTDSMTKDEVILEMQAELVKLRAAAKSASDNEELRVEVQLLRDKTDHLEKSLAEENKLKQELFRALRSTRTASGKQAYDVASKMTSPHQSPTPSGYAAPEPIAPSDADSAHFPGSKISYSFSSPSPSSFLSNGEHTLFEPFPLPSKQSPVYPTTPVEDDPFYSNCGKFGAPSPASSRSPS